MFLSTAILYMYEYLAYSLPEYGSVAGFCGNVMALTIP
jgi:hypothetical protein